MATDLQSPATLDAHAPSYREDAWKEYTLAELGQFVHLLAKRAAHRANPAKRDKDLYDARNYLRMMEAHLDALEEARAETA